MSSWFTEQLAGRPVMAILRGFGVDRTVELARTAWDVGISCVEVPVQGAEDLEALRATVAAGAEQGRAVGAGTVVSPDLLRTVVEAGAAFTVAPGLDEEVVRASAELGVPHLPGVATATEVHTALRWGLTWLKAFPAAQLGPGWVRAMHGPFPTARFVTTGGIDAHNAQEFLDAGAEVVAVGSALGDAAQLPLLGQLVPRAGSGTAAG
ncbi:bifunctional 4-hydroxy-2-oxoglutarate aldolase/2-dehydro-3-deoxy-phosphogluconate aldolase [Auraticoccus monumenti]|nr:bifunctional 4-hydroxy-2-oxoglutarate aldolase/2-dehydro-3-deoxy-phosphogluconate aldolase [Auraticoccus monumenti]